MKFPHLSLVLFFSILHFFQASTAQAEADLNMYYLCGSTNFTVNSTYQSNLNTLFTSLTTNATKSPKNFGFSSGMIGNGPNQISGLVLCRGDINSSTCSSCLSQATQDIQNICPYAKEANIYYDECLLGYSNQHFLPAPQNSELVYVWNTQNITGSKAHFDDLVTDLMNSITEYASNNNSKFGTGMMNSSNLFPVIYGLVQCTPDFSDSDCMACLVNLIGQMPKWFSGRLGGRILGLRCNIRYEIGQFYEGVSMLKLTAPSGGITPAPAPSLSLSPPVIHPNPTLAAPAQAQGGPRSDGVINVVSSLLFVHLVVMYVLFQF